MHPCPSDITLESARVHFHNQDKRPYKTASLYPIFSVAVPKANLLAFGNKHLFPIKAVWISFLFSVVRSWLELEPQIGAPDYSDDPQPQER